MKRLVLLVFAVLPLFMVAQTPKKVAVWETKCSDGSITSFQSTMVRGGMETAVGNTAGYEVYDRSAFDAIMKEQNFQRSGAVSDSQIKKLGEMAGVQYIIVPEATASGAEFYILVKMLDVETGRFGAVYEVLCGTSGTEIKKACEELGSKLFGGGVYKSEFSSENAISGEVIPRDKGVEDYYPKDFGGLRLRTAHLAMNNLLNTEVRTDSIGVVNMTNAPMRVCFQNVPKHISIRMEPSTLAARKSYDKMGQEGYIIVTYDGSQKGDWGFLQDRIAVVVNDRVDSKNKITVSATLVEDFSHLSTTERANAPKIVFTKTEYNFGTIKQGAKPTYDFYFRNEGKSNLIIRKVNATCSCIVPNPEKSVVGPGEKSYIKVTFNSAGKKGHHSKPITIITNDPTNSSMILKMVGEVYD